MAIIFDRDDVLKRSESARWSKILDIEMLQTTGTEGEGIRWSPMNTITVSDTPGAGIRKVDGGTNHIEHWPRAAMLFLPKKTSIWTKSGGQFNTTTFAIPDHWFQSALLGTGDLGSIQFEYFELSASEFLLNSAIYLAQLARLAAEDQSPMLAEAIVISLVAQLVHRFAGGRQRRSIAKQDKLPPAKLQTIIDYIEANMHRVIRIGEMAALTDLSPFHFSRAFRSATGHTPLRHVMERRVEAAKRLMLASGTALVDIALATGFSSQPHFTTAFKHITGVTPQQFRDGQ